MARAEHRRLLGTSVPQDWRAAADAFDEVGIRAAVAYAQMREAELHLAGRSGRAAAQDALREAAAVARAMGAVPLLREIESLAGRARLDLQIPPEAPEAVAEAPAGLTTREVEVLRLVAIGRTNRQIAAELFITEKTAGLHVSNILSKLAVANRSEAAAVAHRLALLPEGADAPAR